MKGESWKFCIKKSKYKLIYIMKIIKILFLLSLLLGFIFYFFSCEKDFCEDIVCLNGGICNDGSCVCVDGYDGVDCGIFLVDKFVGIYSVVVVCNGFNYNYMVSIIKLVIEVNKIIIDNFGDLNCVLGYVVEVIVNGNEFIFIGGFYCEEGFFDFIGYLFIGIGFIDGNIIIIIYDSDYIF